MSLPHISGIQQVGIGVSAVYDVWHWYRKHLGFDLPMFDEAAQAALMLPYTGGEPRSRHAILALNHQGGGGLEIWQYTDRTPEPAAFEIELGDLGTTVAKFKCIDIKKAQAFMSQSGVTILSDISIQNEDKPHFFGKDPWGNIFQVIEGDTWLRKGLHELGGVAGAVIGVSDMDLSLPFYQKLLGYDKVISDKTGKFEDLASLPGGSQEFRRVLLAPTEKKKGPFAPLFGNSEIELIQKIEGKGRKIFKNRLWGDLGYIHLCFDVIGMDALREKCASFGTPFTVDSGDFDMGDAAGQFAYIEDPDGTLIEFVETQKIPLVKKMSWFLDLRKRNRLKPLPWWMLRAMGLGRKKA